MSAMLFIIQKQCREIKNLQIHFFPILLYSPYICFSTAHNRSRRR